MKGIVSLCLFNLMVTGAAIAANSPFTFSLPGYPKEQTDCLSLATKLGEKFKQVTNLEVDVATCKAESKDSFDIQIVYFSETAVPVVSTWPAATGVYQTGRFTTRKECDDLLASESQEFQHQTGLFPTFAYCFNSARHDYPINRAEKTWGPRIVAFGKSAVSYRLGGFSLFALPKDPKTLQLRSKLDQSLKAKNAKFVDVVVQSHGPYADIVSHYYSENEVSFDLDEDIRTKTYDECEQQRPELEALFGNSANPPVFSFCGTTMVPSSVELDMLFLDGSPYRRLDTFEEAKTFAECRAALPALKAKYAAQTKKDIKGGACSLDIDDKVFHTFLYYL